MAPTRASSRAVTRPSPLLAPVTITVRPENEGRSAAVQSAHVAHPISRDAARLFRELASVRVQLLGGASARDVEPLDDRLDVGRLLDGLVGLARDGELDEVALIRRRRAVGMTMRL